MLDSRPVHAAARIRSSRKRWLAAVSAPAAGSAHRSYGRNGTGTWLSEREHRVIGGQGGRANRHGASVPPPPGGGAGPCVHERYL